MILLFAASASAKDNPIVVRMTEFAKAYNEKDAQAVSEFYTPEAVLLPPRSNALVGRKPIAAHFAKAFKRGVAALDYKILKIEQVGPETAIEIGQAQVKVGEQRVTSRSFHVWKNSGGTWQLSYDMYHVLQIKK